MRRGGGSPHRSPTIRTPGRVRALIGQRITTTTRHAGTHEGCEPPHASDDTRLDLSDHGQAGRLSSEGSDSRPIGPVQLRPQLNSGSRFRTERTFPIPGTVVVSGVWIRVASSTPDAVAHGPTTCPPRSGGLPPPPGSSELPNHAGTDSGRCDSARTAATVLVVHVHDDVAT